MRRDEIDRDFRVQRMFEKFWIGLYALVDPPKSPLKRGTLNPVPPFSWRSRSERARGLGGSNAGLA
jgi:hypothetical protein